MVMVTAADRRLSAPRDPAGERELAARLELAALLAGADDLDGDYDSTVELARHLRARRATAGQAVDVGVVILDLEACLRSQPPATPEDVRPGVGRLTGADLVTAIAAARAEFDRRIRQHLAIARTALEK